MAFLDVFLSYGRDDQARASIIFDALRAEGFSVWWDEGLQNGEHWRSQLTEQLATARAVAVLWSSTSVQSAFVRDEAQAGAHRNILCPALIDDVAPPLGFGELQTANLVAWSGKRSDPAWQYFVAGLRAKTSGQPAPVLRRVPRPRASPWTPIASTIGLVAALLTIVLGAEQLGFIHILPAGMVGTPHASPADAAAWRSAQASTGSCAAFRQYLRSYPNGAFVTQAQALLAGKTERPTQRWSPVSEPSLVTGSSNLSERATQASACTSAQESASRNAQNGCQLYSGDTAHFRNMSLVMAPGECDCRDYAMHFDGPGDDQVSPIWRCTVRTTYQCRGEQAEQQSEEFCGSENQARPK